MGWFKRRRFRRLVATIAAVASMALATQAKADWSKQTKTAYSQASKNFKLIQGKEDWSEQEMKQFADGLVNFMEYLARDIINDLRKGDYVSAKSEFKTFQDHGKIIEDLGRFKDIEDDYVLVTNAVKSALRKLGKKENGSSLRKLNLPEGTYVFKSVKEGWPFYLKITIKNTGAGTMIDYSRKGLPIVEGQWEEASAGKPASIVKYVAKILEKSSPGGTKVYQNLKVEGN